MQISNASFPHSAGRHPVLMTRICLRPQRVHDSVTIRNSDFQLLIITQHILVCIAYHEGARSHMRLQNGQSLPMEALAIPHFQVLPEEFAGRSPQRATSMSAEEQIRELQAWSAFKDKEIQDLKVKKLEADLSLKDKFMRLAYWIMFQI
jgi:hypothetical protein